MIKKVTGEYAGGLLEVEFKQKAAEIDSLAAFCFSRGHLSTGVLFYSTMTLSICFIILKSHYYEIPRIT
jgi:hypothetical protein